ncbi:MAG: translation initiation factor IF-2 [Lachnospiraceae bacterium]
MAKRISVFSKEYVNLDNSKVIEILEKNGIANKKAQSGLSEEEEALVVKELRAMGVKKVNEMQEEAPEKAEVAKPEAPEKAEAAKTDVSEETAKPAAPEKVQERPASSEEAAKPAQENNTAGDQDKANATKTARPDGQKNPVKKKNIIIVGNQQNHGGSRNNNFNNNRGNNSYGGNNFNNNRNDNRPVRPNGPIRPRENMVDRAAEVTNRRLQAEREEQMRMQAQQEAKQAAENENQRLQSSAQGAGNMRDNNQQRTNAQRNNFRNEGNRPQGGFNRNDGNRPQGGFNRNDGNRPQGGFNRNDGNRPQGGFNRAGQGGFNRAGQGGDNRFNDRNNDLRRNNGGKPSFTAEAIIPENDKRQDRRSQGQADRDKRSKKDQIYEEDNEIVLGKGRNSKAGRFIKPVKAKETVVEDDIKVIVIPDKITVKDLSDKMKIQPSVIVKKLFMQGEMVTINEEIPFEKAELIALDFDIMCEREEKVDVIAELLKEEEEPEECLKERPPVICVMGHVDHGKTSLLDAIRKTNVTDREAGGITQHIGAYTVNVKGRQITFLDTPGHEAFTSMRMRGANSTDIAILVVAADDGVMPQTVEAINHAKAAGIEILVAVNKIDKPGANIDRVKQELTEYELIAEDWGGQTIFAPVSAKTGEGIEELLEMILLSADVLELKANPNRKARGLVIEAELDKGRGPVATVLVQKGVLHVGDFISAGASHGKVRAMIDDKGRRVKEAGPSVPVEILGLNDVPNAGEIFIIHNNDKDAKFFSETFIAQNKEKLLEETKGKMSLDDLFSKIQEGNLKELNLIIKADVQGSVEAVKQSMLKLSNEEVIVKVIHGGVGAINESDVILASASQAIIIGFNVRPDAMAKQTAEREGVDVRLYKVIYQAIEDVEAAMKGMLDPVYEEKIIGHAEVRQIFKASQVGNIAGSFVLDGVFQRDCKIRITREGEQIYEGSLASLKRFKDDVKEVKAGYECGLVFEDFDKMQELDIVEAYIMVEVPR